VVRSPVRNVCIAFLLFAVGLLAQLEPAARNLEGLVTNAAGQPVKEAVVQLKNTKTLQIRSYITSENGRYHFAGLSTDVEYQVKAQRGGDETSWKTLSVFDTKKTAVINLKLKK
jgi:Carboxypeptidase regulatory-like domain